MNIKDKINLVTKNLQNLLDDSSKNKNINVVLNLSEEHAVILQIVKTFVKAVDETLTDEDIINMIFRNGLIYEINRIKESKQQIYDMGNLEMIADENNVGLTTDDRKIAAASISGPKTIDEYWDLGYITIRCPICKARAVLNPVNKNYYCLDGCRKSGVLPKESDNI